MKPCRTLQRLAGERFEFRIPSFGLASHTKDVENTKERSSRQWDFGTGVRDKHLQVAHFQGWDSWKLLFLSHFVPLLRRCILAQVQDEPQFMLIGEVSKGADTPDTPTLARFTSP